MLIEYFISLPDMAEHFVFPLGMEQLQLFATDDGDMVANITFSNLNQTYIKREQKIIISCVVFSTVSVFSSNIIQNNN